MRGPRKELERQWNTHLKRQFPREYDEVVERFGPPAEHPAVQGDEELRDLFHAWGTADLRQYENYVVGFVSRVLEGSHSGPIVIGDVPADARLARYLEACHAEADGRMRRKIEACAKYLDQLDELLELARTVPAH